MAYPVVRMRRLRKNQIVRNMVRENSFNIENFIYPVFVVHGNGIRNEIPNMNDNYHLSLDKVEKEIEELRLAGINKILLFGVPEKKDSLGTEAYSENGIVQQAVRKIKGSFNDVMVITDVCLCEYTQHGHCGIIKNDYLVNDESVELISKTALSHVEAGSDMVAPSAMLDGQIKAIRSSLDESGFSDIPIMAYSAKYASTLYANFFKYGTGSSVQFGDKKTHQMDFANGNEALREIALDIEEGADIIMVKPAMMYLDIVYRAKSEFNIPLAVYNVSGEFEMVENISRDLRWDLKIELMTAFKRAGADMIISYHAKEIARNLKN
ncbi:MAG: porphobilinogen synthase [Chitinispirillaceae bacterium]|nr:porphobilinogen synthase [Chitinispirillaceae bacterium]